MKVYKWDGHVCVKEYGGRYLKKEAALAKLPDAEGEEINAALAEETALDGNHVSNSRYAHAWETPNAAMKRGESKA